MSGNGATGAPEELYVGLMTGTSLDGVDAVLADCAARVPRVLQHVHRPLAERLRSDLLALNAPGNDEIHRAALAGRDLAGACAAAVDTLLDAAGVRTRDVRAIGAHGQTVRHRPDLGYTVQVNAPALLAELTGIDVIADFRSRDVAAGGQGAPLAPAFHRVAFGGAESRAVVNIGGISNVTAIDGEAVIGFDTGPGNVLIDAWMNRHFGVPFDRDGARAATATPDSALVESLLADPYFAMPPPKSTGRDLFTLEWVQQTADVAALEPAVVLASLTELTARCIGEAIQRWAPQTQSVFVCGGGARNATLMRRLQHGVGARVVASTAALGIAPDQVEALAFAWLAQCHVRRAAGNLTAVTGARGPRILGALYPAGRGRDK